MMISQPPRAPPGATRPLLSEGLKDEQQVEEASQHPPPDFWVRAQNQSPAKFAEAFSPHQHEAQARARTRSAPLDDPPFIHISDSLFSPEEKTPWSKCNSPEPDFHHRPTPHRLTTRSRSPKRTHFFRRNARALLE